jgi:1H-pyrrole-2-carbonyl-[peptidyl-carrier protein] chlorinase
MTQHDCDVAIIGGGPAGSAIGAYLAKGGLSCVLFEREVFPREHVGESLVPSSTRVLQELGLLEKLNAAAFPRKYGAAWTGPASKRVYDHNWEGLEPNEYAGFAFNERSQPGVEQDYTYHVDRGKFDEILLKHAEELGVTVHQGTVVTDVDLDDPAEAKLEYDTSGQRHRISARLVVDASGRRTFLGNKLKLRDPVFNQYALHTWFDGYDRAALAGASERADYIFIHFLPINDSWIWQIPITDAITSIGVVTQRENFAGSKQDRQDFFWSCLESRPELAQLLREAQQLKPLKDEGDYSYAMKSLGGDGFVLVGDAARFVDPIFSTGVSIALNSARFASRDIIAMTESRGFRKEDFETFEQTMRRGMANWYRFISVYYRLNVLFTAFVNDPKYRLDVLKLLQGDVYDEDAPPVLARMREILDTVESDSAHPWHPHLGSVTTQEAHALL